MKRFLLISVALAALLAGVSCSVTRKIPQDSFLVQKVTIETDKSTPRKERIPASELKKYIRQFPNKRLLGLNFYAWIYEQADPKKDNWWNNFKRRMGEEPGLLDVTQTQQSARNLKSLMDYRGFFSSEVDYQIDTISRKKREMITYSVVQRKHYRIDSIS